LAFLPLKEIRVALADGWKSAATLLIGGAIGVILAPTLAPALAGAARPAAKAAIKAGLLLFDRARLAAAELRESVEDITAEVQAELAESNAPPPGSSAEVTAGSEAVH
jgi:Protein of unknown function (DUF5132)